MLSGLRTLVGTALVGSLQSTTDPLATPPATAPPCRATPAVELPARPDGDPTRRFVAHRGYEVQWERGLGGGRRIRLLEDTLKRSVLLVTMASPSLPSAATPEIVSATIDSAGRVAGMRTTLPRDPADIADRQRALAQGDTLALRAAFARDNTPLKPGDLERVRTLSQWMRNACAGEARPSPGMPQGAPLPQESPGHTVVMPNSTLHPSGAPGGPVPSPAPRR